MKQVLIILIIAVLIGSLYKRTVQAKAASDGLAPSEGGGSATSGRGGSSSFSSDPAPKIDSPYQPPPRMIGPASRPRHKINLPRIFGKR